MRIKILSYNIHKGLSSLGTSFTLEMIREAIRKTDVDICFLQEVVGKNNNLKLGRIENQFEYLADTVWSYFSYAKNASYPKGDHGNAILSFFPIISEHNLNLTLNRYEQRGLQHVLVKDPVTEKKVHLLNTHLNLRSRDRLIQIESIFNYIIENIREDDSLIMCGDFNDWNYKIHSYLVNRAGFEEAGDILGQGLRKTFPSIYPVLSLDRIYCRNVKVISSEVLSGKSWTAMSDHLPILSEVEV